MLGINVVGECFCTPLLALLGFQYPVIAATLYDVLVFILFSFCFLSFFGPLLLNFILRFFGNFVSFSSRESMLLLLQLSFDLAKQGGMMRKFTGSWKIEPMRASEAAASGTVAPTSTSSSATEDDHDPVVGSWVTFQQVVEPTIKPPWPLSNYIRGITEQIIREMLADLQRECQRLSELRKTSPSSSIEVDTQTQLTPKVS